MLLLSQIIFGVADLDAAADRFQLGFDVLDGGVHPGVGTANRIIPLGEQYLELLGVVSPELARESEYGRSLMRVIANGDRLVRWSLRTDAIDAVAQRLGLTVDIRERRRRDRSRRTRHPLRQEKAGTHEWVPTYATRGGAGGAGR